VDLKTIKAPIASELKEFEVHFRDSMKSQVALLDRIMYYIVKRKGKQLRPMFVFLCARLHGDSNPSTYVAASMVELLHTASLVHDDVVDEAHKRRGFFSINALWKNKIATLVGDYLFSRGLLVALESKEFRHLEILSSAVKTMVEGELLQLEKARKLNIKEDVYYEIIKGKTASLISSACAVGSASTSENDDDVEKMKIFGEKIGMAFQIKDDLFDYGELDVGKPRGIDIKEKKITLPLIYALNNTSSSQKRKILNGIKKKSKNKAFIEEVIQFVRSSGGIEYSIKKMESYRDEAFQMLSTYPDSPIKDSLSGLVEYVISRKI